MPGCDVKMGRVRKIGCIDDQSQLADENLNVVGPCPVLSIRIRCFWVTAWRKRKDPLYFWKCRMLEEAVLAHPPCLIRHFSETLIRVSKEDRVGMVRLCCK